jgi:hypothetical protein
MTRSSGIAGELGGGRRGGGEVTFVRREPIVTDGHLSELDGVLIAEFYRVRDNLVRPGPWSYDPVMIR